MLAVFLLESLQKPHKARVPFLSSCPGQKVANCCLPSIKVGHTIRRATLRRDNSAPSLKSVNGTGCHSCHCFFFFRPRINGGRRSLFVGALDKLHVAQPMSGSQHVTRPLGFQFLGVNDSFRQEEPDSSRLPPPPPPPAGNHPPPQRCDRSG